MESADQVIHIPPVIPDEMINRRKESNVEIDIVHHAAKYETPYSQEKIQNDLNMQLKDRETSYVPRDWVVSKLDQIKANSSLSVETTVLADTVNINKNILSMNVKTYLDNNATMELHLFEDGIFKINCVNPANPSKFSFELLDKPANLTPYALEGKVIVGAAQAEVTLADVHAKVIVKFAPFNVTLISTKGEAQEVLFEMNTKNSLKFDENLAADFTFGTKYLYGLPERAYNLLLEDTKTDLPYRFYTVDNPAFPVGSKNGLYGAVPIIVGRSKNSSTLVTMYWQNASDTYIDIHRNNASTDAFWLSERGNLECYVFVSHDNKSHFRSLSNVFGHCAMPQYWTLGYHQCRWSYEDQEDTLKVNQGFNDYEIPCDSITLDIDHTDGCKYFTWNETLYPDVPGMLETIVNDKRQLITIQDPHIKVDEEYHVYKEAAEKELWVKTKDGEPFVGKCWPGQSIYFDYLNEETRDCWASQYGYDKYKYATPNIWAWNDMNEPSVFDVPGNHMPVDNLHTVKSKANPELAFQVEHREVHNIYGYGQHKATYDGMLKRNKDQNIRPHVLSRSFFAGSQKYTAIWTGDTGVTWEYLKITVPQLLSLSLCGISNVGGDVGGFAGDPEVELAVRWYQLGTFMPFFRGHSAMGTQRREPWLYEKKYADLIKEAIKERYRLLPYYYTAFEEHCRTAVPLLRPTWFDQEKVVDEANYKDQERLLIGDALLVVPILEKGATSIKGALNGLAGRWYDYFTKREATADEEIKTGLERIGCFVKGGHIIPTFEIKTHTQSSQDAKLSNIHLFVGVDEEDNAKGKLYSDDGHSFDYKNGGCLINTFEFSKNILTYKAGQATNGYKLTNRVTKVVIAGVTDKFENAYLVEDGKKRQKVQFIKRSGSILVELVALANKNWKIVFE